MKLKRIIVNIAYKHSSNKSIEENPKRKKFVLVEVLNLMKIKIVEDLGIGTLLQIKRILDQTSKKFTAGISSKQRNRNKNPLTSQPKMQR